MARIFLSYSHDSENHKAATGSLAARLRGLGHEVHLDQDVESPPEGWPAWMEQQIRFADKVLAICSIGYKSKLQREVAQGTGKGAKWEGSLICNAIYQAEKNTKFIPVIIESDVGWDIPTILEPYTHYNLREGQFQKLASALGGSIPEAKPDTPTASAARPTDRKGRLFLEHGMPDNQSVFVGRSKELGKLNEAWTSTITNIIEIVAWGGSGKTALVANWLVRLAKQPEFEAIPVIAWSFYSQGSFDNEVSAANFLDSALDAFDEAMPGQRALEKGRKLAELVRTRRTLVILDGMEGLQISAGPEAGRIKDPGLSEFVRQLTLDNPGLLVITSRVGLASLAAPDGEVFVRLDLADMPPSDGAALLRNLGVTGPHAELEQASVEYGGHALALNLLGPYLRDAFHGDIRRRSEIPILDQADVMGGHARRVLESYERWLAQSNPQGSQLVHLLGLFDGPAPMPALHQVRATSLPGLTNELHASSTSEVNRAIASLVAANLVHDRVLQEGTIDCHPLVRAYFQEKLEHELADSAKEAHRILFRHFSGLAPDLPTTVPQVAQLVEAITHACRSGLEIEALDQIYKKRIQHGDQFYAFHQLAAAGPVLTAMSAFFTVKWDKLLPTLSAKQQAFLLNQTAMALRSLGRIEESLQPTRLSLDHWISVSSWTNAFQEAANLTDHLVNLGRLSEAYDAAVEAEKLARKSDENGAELAAKATRAWVLANQGRTSEAGALFREAFNVKQGKGGPSEFWHAIYGAEFALFLAENGDHEAAESKASRNLKGALRAHLPAEVGVAKFAVASCLLLNKGASKVKRKEAGPLLEEAHGLVVEAGQQTLIPAILLAKGRLKRIGGDFDGAQEELDEAEQIVWRCGLRLLEVDCLIEQALLFADRADERSSFDCYSTAAKRIEALGYERRRKQVEALPHKAILTKAPTQTARRRGWLERLLK
jgi:tetratricopeptide (TPR) repeat protein